MLLTGRGEVLDSCRGEIGRGRKEPCVPEACIYRASLIYQLSRRLRARQLENASLVSHKGRREL